jgi:uncharacterized membrane protein YoaK (UPF0700 family)
MFRHQGNTRTLHHNLKIASLLSFVAGIVNVVGFLAVQRLTTNVTGHFAFIVDNFLKVNYWQAFIYFLYVFFFLLGSFVSNFIVEIMSRIDERYTFVVSICIESLILLVIALSGHHLIISNPDLIAFSLLFAMGLQNSLVTKISNSVVRTTHLTGLFTDLGIELSQLFFYKTAEQKKKLTSSIKLRLSIISFFFMGGIFGGIFYSKAGTYTLLAGSALLLAGLVYDDVKFKIISFKRKLQGH